MIVKKWDDLPLFMQNEYVYEYYIRLRKKRCSLFMKRVFDIVFASVMLILFLPLFAILSLFIIMDAEGGAFYRQTRITQYGKPFKILKFRTMVKGADQNGSEITANGDARITKLGKFLRKTRLDETIQLVHICSGKMTFVGTRPETPKFVGHYTDEMLATLLLPAGVTSEASIKYKDENLVLSHSANVEEDYIYKVLPQKMRYNLTSMEGYSFFGDMKIMVRTVAAVMKRDGVDGATETAMIDESTNEKRKVTMWRDKSG